ncbi:ran guanine nucleotide release factor-like [Ptychodera flava]|uniref:ran guanine nucleotide release factor-like n=1 Tax=Ptychodera flava TaxID=63121 RepID=UPI00396A845A
MALADFPLFGGAMTIALPQGANDVSSVREIPDNQEVFTHPSTDQSIIIEIMEYQDIEDQNAPSYHFEDISESNNSTSSQVEVSEQIPKEQIAMKQCKSAWFLSGKQLVAKFNEQAQNTINIYVALYRLPEYETDILLTLNDPVSISIGSSSHVPAESYNQNQPWTLQQFRQCVTTLKILDTSLFGE